MANEITYNQTDGSFSTEYRLARDSMLEALYETAGSFMRHLWRKSLAGFHSTTERFTKKPKLAASAIADGVDMTNTPYTPSTVNLTVSEVGLTLTQTDLNARFSLLDFREVGMEMGEAIAEKLLSDISSLGGGFSRSVGSSGNDLTEAQFLSARQTLRLLRMKEPYVAVLYPVQLDDLVQDSGTTLAPILYAGGPNVRSEAQDLTPRAGIEQGVMYRTEIYTPTTVPTANAGADSAGFMFSARRAIAMVEGWATRLESERDASLRATEMVGTSAYAVGEVDDDAGVGIITDR
ncbi:MAG TPA: hypothetical protein VF377_06905 [Acidimicrobiia bacterium]